MKLYIAPEMELQIIDAQDIVCASGNQPAPGISVGNGGSDIKNWQFQF